jgi:hypothetical protein
MDPLTHVRNTWVQCMRRSHDEDYSGVKRSEKEPGRK